VLTKKNIDCNASDTIYVGENESDAVEIAETKYREQEKRTEL
jgi:hypothetical protein